MLQLHGEVTNTYMFESGVCGAHQTDRIAGPASHLYTKHLRGSSSNSIFKETVRHLH